MRTGSLDDGLNSGRMVGCRLVSRADEFPEQAISLLSALSTNLLSSARAHATQHSSIMSSADYDDDMGNSKGDAGGHGSEE